jgi:hypothetical protein
MSNIDTNTLNKIPDLQVAVNDGGMTAVAGQSIVYSIAYTCFGVSRHAEAGKCELAHAFGRPFRSGTRGRVQLPTFSPVRHLTQ